MKTLEQILKKWYNPNHLPLLAQLQIEEAMKEYAIEVAKEALKNASENVATKQGYFSDGWTPSVKVVDKQSILSESNIPELK